MTADGQVIQSEQLSKDLHSLYTTQKESYDESNAGYLSLPEQTRRLEIILIKKAMRRTKGNKTRTAKLLAITRQGLDKKIKRYNLVI